MATKTRQTKNAFIGNNAHRREREKEANRKKLYSQGDEVPPVKTPKEVSRIEPPWWKLKHKSKCQTLIGKDHWGNQPVEKCFIITARVCLAPSTRVFLGLSLLVCLRLIHSIDWIRRHSCVRCSFTRLSAPDSPVECICIDQSISPHTAVHLTLAYSRTLSSFLQSINLTLESSRNSIEAHRRDTTNIYLRLRRLVRDLFSLSMESVTYLQTKIALTQFYLSSFLL